MASPEGNGRLGAAPRPFPLRLPVPEGRHVRARGLRVGTVVGRHFARLALARLARRPLAENAFAAPLRRTFEDLGATFLKVGQLMASSPGVFGEDVANEFRSCLDTGPVVPFDEVRGVVEHNLGARLEDRFASFEEVPIGRASVAVVHRATLLDGRVVAVKVLRPGIERAVATDLRLIGPLLDFLARRVGVAAAGQLIRLLDGFKEQIAEELDLRNEARAMIHYRELVAALGLRRVAVPEPFVELSGPRVLTMEFLDGVVIDDLERVAALGVDPRPVIQEVVQAWFITALRDGTFHGDVHAGNLLLLRDGRMGVLDWGIVGQLDARTHRFFRRTIEAALGDEAAWDDVARDLIAAYGPGLRQGLGLTDDQLAAFIRGVMEPMLNRPFGEVSLGTFFAAFQGQVAEAEGRAIEKPTWRDRLAEARRARRLHIDVVDHGGLGTSFDRGSFLLAKQLLYFERYGKMFLADVSILSDRVFFEKVLAEGPVAT